MKPPNLEAIHAALKDIRKRADLTNDLVGAISGNTVDPKEFEEACNNDRAIRYYAHRIRTIEDTLIKQLTEKVIRNFARHVAYFLTQTEIRKVKIHHRMSRHAIEKLRREMAKNIVPHARRPGRVPGGVKTPMPETTERPNVPPT